MTISTLQKVTWLRLSAQYPYVHSSLLQPFEVSRENTQGMIPTLMVARVTILSSRRRELEDRHFSRGISALEFGTLDNQAVLYCAPPPGSRIHWIPWIPWNSMDIHRLRKCNFKKFEVDFWVYGCLQNPVDSMEFHGIQWTSINTELKLTLLSLQYSSRYSHK